MASGIMKVMKMIKFTVAHGVCMILPINLESNLTLIKVQKGGILSMS